MSPVAILQCLMNAGTDTSALTVEWGMAELMANPNLRKQAQAEIDAVVGQDRRVQESDLPNLPFLRAVVKETYRMHPSLPLGVRRESHEPCVVSGCELPAHTELILNIFAIHRDASVYESPDEFKPSRFLDRPEVDPLSGHDHYELMPFGAGRRMCAGYNLGNVMVTSMLANLLQCFDWSLPGGESAESLDMSEYFSFTSCRRHPLCLVAQPRRAASLLQLPL
jgi:cytochrome P450